MFYEKSHRKTAAFRIFTMRLLSVTLGFAKIDAFA